MRISLCDFVNSYRTLHENFLQQNIELQYSEYKLLSNG